MLLPLRRWLAPRRRLNYFRFYHATRRILDTPPLERRDGPVAIVSMVAGYDVQMYILAVKALYRRLGGGSIVPIVAGDVSASSRELMRRHLGDLEFIDLDSIDVGNCQRGGTWERLIYIVKRSSTQFVIQMDCDALCVGPLSEVMESIEINRSFTLAEGLPKKPLADYVTDGLARDSDNIVISFERMGDRFPKGDDMLYIRGSPGFAGFARGGQSLSSLERFYSLGKQVLGDRWTEWGTEQIASNFTVANSPNSIPLPNPRYMSYQRNDIPSDVNLLHFLGYCRFDNGIFAEYANREIDAMLR